MPKNFSFFRGCERWSVVGPFVKAMSRTRCRHVGLIQRERVVRGARGPSCFKRNGAPRASDDMCSDKPRHASRLVIGESRIELEAKLPKEPHRFGSKGKSCWVAGPIFSVVGRVEDNLVILQSVLNRLAAAKNIGPATQQDFPL